MKQLLLPVRWFYPFLAAYIIDMIMIICSTCFYFLQWLSDCFDCIWIIKVVPYWSEADQVLYRPTSNTWFLSLLYRQNQKKTFTSNRAKWVVASSMHWHDVSLDIATQTKRSCCFSLKRLYVFILELRPRKIHIKVRIFRKKLIMFFQPAWNLTFIAKLTWLQQFAACIN